MCDPALFARHYSRVLKSLGQRVYVLPDGTIHTVHADLNYAISNTAPYEPEYLVVECPAPAGADPAAVAELIERIALPRSVNLEIRYDQVIAQAELVLAGPGNLPEPRLLAAVLPPLFERLVLPLRDYMTELALVGIQRATEVAEQGDL